MLKRTKENYLFDPNPANAAGVLLSNVAISTMTLVGAGPEKLTGTIRPFVISTFKQILELNMFLLKCYYTRLDFMVMDNV